MTTSEFARLRELADERASIMADLESCTNELKVAIQQAVAAGRISELGASKLTGVGRTTIRTWVGKT